MPSDYQNKKASLLTKHGKEEIIGPILARSHQLEVELITTIDTDDLGTFDRLVQRKETQFQTVRKKAKLAIQHGRHSLGMASEGSFILDPFSGFMPWNVEMVILIDEINDLEIVGVAQGIAKSMSRLVSCLSELNDFANESGFPSHHLMMRPESENDLRVVKGICDAHDLEKYFFQSLKLSRNQKVFVENDLRAFCNPTRQIMIAKATDDLANKLSSKCPQCDRPGFWKSKAESGLPCKACGLPTRVPINEIWSCRSCKYHSRMNHTHLMVADPSSCDFCNP